MKGRNMLLRRLIPYIVMFVFLTQGALAQISWTTIGPGGGGWLTTIEISPHDPGVVYVGCDVGGIYKSTNSGVSWQIINNGLTNYYILDIAIDPQTSATLYAATQGGVFKSTDSGDSWAIKRNGFPQTAHWSFSSPIAAIVIDPNNATIVYAVFGLPRVYR